MSTSPLRIRTFGSITLLAAVVAACGSSSSSTETSTNGTTSSAESACDAAKKRTVECKGADADAKTGELECRTARCLWVAFRDAQSLSDRMATRACKDDVDDFLDDSVEAHLDEPGVRDFITACKAEAAKGPAQGGCNDPGKSSFSGHCEYYAAMNDAARETFGACLGKATCADFQRCYDAIFDACGNWR